jgi:hypothetical protein
MRRLQFVSSSGGLLFTQGLLCLRVVSDIEQNESFVEIMLTNLSENWREIVAQELVFGCYNCNQMY